MHLGYKNLQIVLEVMTMCCWNIDKRLTYYMQWLLVEESRKQSHFIKTAEVY